MIDFSLFDKALKITWVKRLCSDDSGPWKLIPLSLLSNLGGKLLFQMQLRPQIFMYQRTLTKILSSCINTLTRIKLYNA